MDTICKQSKKHFLAIFSLLFLSFFLSINPVFAQDGEKIFKENCAVCHSMGKETVTGPGLEGVMKRVPSEEWLLKWIKNNDALIKSGDAYAVKINAFAESQMTTFTNLSDDEIKSVIAYIKAYVPPVKKVDNNAGGAAGAAVGSASVGVECATRLGFFPLPRSAWRRQRLALG